MSTSVPVPFPASLPFTVHGNADGMLSTPHFVEVSRGTVQ